MKHSCPPQNVLNVTACIHCITCISHVLTTCSTGIFVHENVLQNNIILLRRNYNENDMNSCPDMIKWNDYDIQFIIIDKHNPEYLYIYIVHV